jgi:hypothetical protein
MQFARLVYEFTLSGDESPQQYACVVNFFRGRNRRKSLLYNCFIKYAAGHIMREMHGLGAGGFFEKKVPAVVRRGGVG